MSKPVLRAWTPVLFWLALVAWESTWLMGANQTSRWLRPLLTFFFGHISNARFFLIHALLRKAGHFFLYGMLSLLGYRAWWATFHAHSAAGPVSWRDVLVGWSILPATIAFLMTAAVAGLDEFHQSLLPNRGGSLHDVLLDSMGAIFAQLVVLSASAWTQAQRQQHEG